MRPGALPAALAVLTALVPDAAANGRPPATSGVYVRPGDARSIYVRSTLGLLVSRDDGCSFRWVCEEAIGYAGRFDPKYAIAAGGTIFATTFTGLRVSRDGGCTWRTATEDRPRGDPGRIAGMWVDAIDIAPDGHVWIATADSGRPNNVYRSTDGGATFAPRGLGSPTIWWKSVKVAPADPRRVYATGYQVAGPPLPDGRPQPPAAHFRRSDDAGARWTPSPLAGVAVGATPIVHAIAVDPARRDVVFLRSLGASPPSGDRLYRSTDAGRTFREVLATSAAIHDVVFHGGAVLVATVSGAFRSADGGATFERLPAAPQLACLGAHGDRLLGCAGNWQPDEKAVASSADGGASWDRVLRFAELAGPLACPAGTPAHDLCGPRWPGLQQQLGAAGTTRCPAPPPDPAPAPAPPPRPKGGGCCDASAGPPPAAAGLLAALAALAFARRRRGSSSHRRPR